MGIAETVSGGWAPLETTRSLDSRAEVFWPAPEVDFNQQTCDMLLHLREPALLDYVENKNNLQRLIGQGIRPMNEMHITVISLDASKCIRRALTPYSEDDKHLVLGHIDEIANDTDWSWQPTGMLYPLYSPGRSKPALKIVEMIDLPSLAPFYGHLNSLFPTAGLTPPPAHITLLKKKCRPGTCKQFDFSGLATEEPLTNLNDLDFQAV